MPIQKRLSINNSDPTWKHQHPIKILTLMRRNFWLLLLPLVRGLIALQFDFYSWLSGAWMDLLVLIFIIGMAWIRWYSLWYQMESDRISCRQGVIVRQNFCLPFHKLSAVSIEHKFYLRPVHAANLYLDTNGGLAAAVDLQMTISQEDCTELYNALDKYFARNPSKNRPKQKLYQENHLPDIEKNSSPASKDAANLSRQLSAPQIIVASETSSDSLPPRSTPIRATVEIGFRQLVFFSFVFSDTLSGIIFLSTFFIQTSDILGEYLQVYLQNAVHTVEILLERVIQGLPPTAIGFSLLLFGGWLFSFIGALLRYAYFQITRNHKHIVIETGIFTKRRYEINAAKIHYADLRQNLMMKFFRVMSVHVSCTGYGKNKNEIPVFIPISTQKHILFSLQLLLPGFTLSPRALKPKWKLFFRHIWLPLVLLAATALIGLILYTLFPQPQLQTLILFCCVMAGLPSIWLLFAKITAFFSTGLSYSEEKICLFYSFLFHFHTVLVPRDHIAKIRIRQSVFQLFTSSCDLRIYTTNEFSKCHRIIGLPLDELLIFLDKAGLCSVPLEFF